MGHKNRSKAPTNVARNPEPNEVREARLAAGLTQTEAAKLIFRGQKYWESIEAPRGAANYRPMLPSDWWLFLMLAAPDEAAAGILGQLRQAQRG